MTDLSEVNDQSNGQESSAVDAPLTEHLCSKCGKTKSVDLFSKYKSGNPRNICKLCDSARQIEYKNKMLSDPKTALQFKTAQSRYSEEYKKRPGVAERMKEHRRAWAQRNPEAVQKTREEYVQRHPDRIKATQKRYRDKVMADPKRHQEFLESRRISYRLRAEREGRKIVRQHKIKMVQTTVRVPTGPFLNWLRPLLASHEYTLGEIAMAAGVDWSGLERILYGRYENMGIDIVDKVLTAVGGPPIASLYPDA